MPKSKRGLQKIDVNEKELENLLINDIEVIEEDMQVLGHQIQTSSGSLDILALDSEGTLVVIELKTDMSDGQLNQGLRYYDWVKSNVEWIARSFAQDLDRKVNVKEDPWLILVAPEFSENLKTVAKYVTVPLILIDYTVVQAADNRKYMICREVDYGTPSEPPVVPTREGHLGYIENEDVKSLCKKCLESLESMKVEIRPLKAKWFSLWYGGKRFGLIGCKKQFFVGYVWLNGAWTGRFRISNKNDWETFLENAVFPSLKEIGLPQQ